MQTIVPVGSFEGKARDLLTDAEFDAMIELIARRPKVGRVVQGTGGLRKVRIARIGGGKSGGARVIYYHHGDGNPILLLLIYAKADQENLKTGQKLALKKLVEEIIHQFG